MSPPSPRLRCAKVGADGGARTRDLRLGKATLYQLSYIRIGTMVNRTNDLESLKEPVNPTKDWEVKQAGIYGILS